jgi:hypothetical protein
MPALAKASAAAAFAMPSCIQTTRGFAARMSSTCAGTSCERLKTLTMSTGPGTSATARKTGLPRMCVVSG